MARKPAKFKRKRFKKTFKKKEASTAAPRPLTDPGIYKFKRTIAETLKLSNSDPPSGWTSTTNNLGKAFGWTLSAVNDFVDFTNLFKYYRLRGARVQMFLSNTTSIGNSAPNNTQTIGTIDFNLNGDASNVATESHYIDSQTAKRKVLMTNSGKASLDIYMPLKQLKEMRNVSGGTATAMTTPTWVGTDNPYLPHFGYNIMLQRVNGDAFASGMTGNQYIKMYTTLYFECKKVE